MNRWDVLRDSVIRIVTRIRDWAGSAPYSIVVVRMSWIRVRRSIALGEASCRR